MTIETICRRDVVTCERDTDVQQLATLMRSEHVGDVIVTEPLGDSVRPVGIITDRDLVVEVLAPGIDAGSVRAGDLMGDHLVTAGIDISVRDAIDFMRTEAVRRLPLVDDEGRLVGIVSLDDCIRYLASTLRDISDLITREREVETTARRSA